MTNLERLIKAEGVQGGVLAEYERRFRRFADVQLDSSDNPENLLEISDAMRAAFDFTGSEEAFDLYVLARRAMAAHIVVNRYTRKASK